MVEETKKETDELEDFIEEEKEKENLPESPASINIKFWVDDFGVLLTMRAVRVSTLVKQLEDILKIAKEKGWKPSWVKEPTVHQTSTQTPSVSVYQHPQGVSGVGQGTTLPLCPVHNRSMRLFKGKWGDFYKCTAKLDDGQWCNEKRKVV